MRLRESSLNFLPNRTLNLVECIPKCGNVVTVCKARASASRLIGRRSLKSISFMGPRMGSWLCGGVRDGKES